MEDAAPFEYSEIPPAPGLAHLVSTHWHVRVGPAYPVGLEHPVWPDGCVSVAVHLGRRDARLVGPRMTALRVPMFPGDRVWGVRFRPHAGPAVLGLEARRLRDRAADAVELLGERVTPLLRSLPRDVTPEEATSALDAWVADHLDRDVTPDALVGRAVERITETDGRLEAGRVARDVGLSLRQLQRRFGRAVGLTPKQFSRIRRMRSTLAKVLDAPRERWSAVAAELGYADQAHLIRDLAKLTGLTPSRVASRLEAITHIGVSP